MKFTNRVVIKGKTTVGWRDPGYLHEQFDSLTTVSAYYLNEDGGYNLSGPNIVQVNDFSGNNNHLTPVNGATATVGSINGTQAGQFSCLGANKGFMSATNCGSIPYSDFTMMMVIQNASGNGGSQYAFGTGNITGFQIASALSFDRIYVNGDINSSVKNLFTRPDRYASTAALYGVRQSGNDEFWLDSVNVFNNNVHSGVGTDAPQWMANDIPNINIGMAIFCMGFPSQHDIDLFYTYASDNFAIPVP